MMKIKAQIKLARRKERAERASTKFEPRRQVSARRSREARIYKEDLRLRSASPIARAAFIIYIQKNIEASYCTAQQIQVNAIQASESEHCQIGENPRLFLSKGNALTSASDSERCRIKTRASTIASPISNKNKIIYEVSKPNKVRAAAVARAGEQGEPCKIARHSRTNSAATINAQQKPVITFDCWKQSPLKRISIICLLALTILSIMPFVSAQSMPLAVHGTVYDLDGETQAPSGTFISINDTTSGYYVEGVTGTFYNSGRYAAAVFGEVGDTVIITASNGYDSNSQSLVLSGSMYDINLFINTTIPLEPNHSPEITSKPITKAYVNRLYKYKVTASDEDNNVLTYSLLKKPRGMVIDPGTGIIEWIPRITQWGRTHPVSVQVSDGRNGTDTQDFTVRVYLTNDISLPNWWNSFNESGGEIIKLTPSEKHTFPDQDKSLRELMLNNPLEEELVYLFYNERETKPNGIETAGKKVYRYIELFPLNVLSESINNTLVAFSVNKEWLNESGASQNDIILKRYIHGHWHITKTSLIKEDEDYAYYESSTNGLDYLAITVGKPEVNDLLDKSLDIPYFIIGTIYEKDGKTQVGAGMPIKIINENTLTEINLATGVGPMTGSYAVILPGEKGDKIAIMPNSDGKSKKSIILSKNKGNYIDFRKKGSGESFNAQVRSIKKLDNGFLEVLRQLFGM
jgi:PGF-pre-PGF domain-containing protein